MSGTSTEQVHQRRRLFAGVDRKRIAWSAVSTLQELSSAYDLLRSVNDDR